MTSLKAFRRRLPNIQTQVVQQLSEAKVALAKFAPVNTEQPQTEVIRLLQEFSRTLAKHIDGVPPSLASFDSLDEDPTDTASTGLLNALNKAYDRFRQRIRDTAPQFRPWSSNLEAKHEELDLLADMKLDDDPLGVEGARVFYLDQVMNMAQKCVFLMCTSGSDAVELTYPVSPDLVPGNFPEISHSPSRRF